MTKKSLFLTYLFWLVGGIFGLHHFYLGRDGQAFLWWSSMGGYFGIGWFFDFFSMYRYVADANEERSFVEKHKEKTRQHVTPPFSSIRFFGMVITAYFYAGVTMIAIPEEEVGGINWYKWCTLFVPVTCALGVWLIGNIGRETGSIRWPLSGAFIIFLLRPLIDDSWWLLVMSIISSLAFDSKAKKWRRTPAKKKSIWKRIAVLSICGVLYLGLWSSWFHFNGKVTDSNGEEIRVSEALQKIFSSFSWEEFFQSFYDAYVYVLHHGWYEAWKLMDPDDSYTEHTALEALNLSVSATPAEIKSKWRALLLEFHPDKVKDSNKKAAEEKFLEIQKAYKFLEKSKSRRKKHSGRLDPF